jgi:hypothetical protein
MECLCAHAMGERHPTPYTSCVYLFFSERGYTRRTPHQVLI